VQKELDPELKQNVFVLSPGQRIQFPPNPAQASQDFHHNKGPATKQMSVSASLNITHPFVVFQVYVPPSCSIVIELTVKDNLNVSRGSLILIRQNEGSSSAKASARSLLRTCRSEFLIV